MPPERYQEVPSPKLHREKNVIIGACEEGKTLDYYPLQSIEKYLDELNKTLEREDIKLTEEMDNESKNQIAQELIIPEIRGNIDKA